MVKIIGYKQRTSNDGKTFNALELMGGVEIITSASGSMYATARKTTVATTFEEEVCKGLIGTELPGNIEKVNCAPYEYTVEKTGEVLILHHRYSFVPEQKQHQPVMEIYTNEEFPELAGMNYSQAM